jgi:hypothetical protein
VRSQVYGIHAVTCYNQPMTNEWETHHMNFLPQGGRDYGYAYLAYIATKIYLRSLFIIPRYSWYY